MSTLPPLFIRVDASPQMGAGHAIRCLTLARAWKDRGGKASLYMETSLPLVEETAAAYGVKIQDLEDAGLFRNALRKGVSAYVVADGYHLGANYELALRQEHVTLAIIDDRFRDSKADVFINLHPTERGDSQPSSEKLLLQGSVFALIRPEIRTIRRNHKKKPSHLLIAFGGTDVAGLAQKTLNYLRTNPPDNFIVRLLKPDAAFGESFKNVKLQSPDWNIAPHLKWADAILCTPSTIALEAACTGIPVFTVTVASNQQGIAFAMEKNRSGESFGTAKDYDPSRVFAAFKKRFQNHPALTRIGENGRQWIDGRGAERIVAALTAVNFQFRAAESSDSELVWHWANDPAVRRASYDSKDIPWKTHQEWYKRKLHSNDDTILITETIDGKPFAVCRFERRDSICTISFSLDSAYRGMGLGRLVLSKACKTYCTAHPKTSIEAQIKIDNLASISTFELAGFRKTQKTGDRLTFCYAA